MKIEDFKIYQFHFGTNCIALCMCFLASKLGLEFETPPSFEPVTEPGLKLSLFVKCIESEFTDSAKYFQNLRQSLMKPAPVHRLSPLLVFSCLKG